jgi:hypothetical protein
MSRTRTLQMLLVVSATAWVMILGAIGGMIAMHVFNGSHPRPRAVVQAPHVYYEHVYRQQAILVNTPYGPRYCCPPPPCCPRSHATYVPYTAPTKPHGQAPLFFVFTSLLAAAALVTGLVSSRRLAPLSNVT